MQKKEIKNLKELKQIAFELAKKLKAPQVILLSGPLAVGKSQLIQYMASALGVPEAEICSPTFSLINSYKKSEKEMIYHIDLYRLKKLEDIETTNFWDIFYEPTIVFIEWPELVQNKLPAFWKQLHIELSFHNQHRILKWEHKK